MSNDNQGKCPVMHGAATTNSSESSTSVRDWWPNNLNLNILHQHDRKSILWKMILITKKSLKKLITMH
jgi:catalase-peroxidase